MKKQRTLCIIALACYLIFVIVGVALAIGGAADLANPDKDGGLASAVTAFAMALMMILGIIYAAFGVVPLILKAIHTFAGKRFPAYICILFDIAYSILHAALLVSTLADGGTIEPMALILPVALLVLSVTSLVVNILSVKKPKIEAV